MWQDKDNTIGIEQLVYFAHDPERPLDSLVRLGLHSDHLNVQEKNRKVVYIVGMEFEKISGEKIEGGQIKIWRASRGKDLHEMCREPEDNFLYMGG